MTSMTETVSLEALQDKFDRLEHRLQRVEDKTQNITTPKDQIRRERPKPGASGGPRLSVFATPEDEARVVAIVKRMAAGWRRGTPRPRVADIREELIGAGLRSRDGRPFSSEQIAVIASDHDLTVQGGFDIM